MACVWMLLFLQLSEDGSLLLPCMFQGRNTGLNAGPFPLSQVSSPTSAFSMEKSLRHSPFSTNDVSHTSVAAEISRIYTSFGWPTPQSHTLRIFALPSFSQPQQFNYLLEKNVRAIRRRRGFPYGFPSLGYLLPQGG